MCVRCYGNREGAPHSSGNSIVTRNHDGPTRASADPRRSSESSARDHLLLCGLHDPVRLDRVALGSAYDHIDLTAAALGADQPLSPIGHRRFGAVSLGHFGRVGLNLVAAILAPNDQPDAGGGCIAERHRRAGLGFHPRPISLCEKVLRDKAHSTRYTILGEYQMRRPAALFSIALALGAMMLAPVAGAQAQDAREQGPREIEKCQTINKPGSYRLVNDLTFTGTTGTCLMITASSVTIDLAGFTISGRGFPFTGVSAAAGTGIAAGNDTTASPCGTDPSQASLLG
jgi:hypothetical protein